MALDRLTALELCSKDHWTTRACQGERALRIYRNLYISIETL